MVRSFFIRIMLEKHSCTQGFFFLFTHARAITQKIYGIFFSISIYREVLIFVGICSSTSSIRKRYKSVGRGITFFCSHTHPNLLHWLESPKLASCYKMIGPCNKEGHLTCPCWRFDEKIWCYVIIVAIYLLACIQVFGFVVSQSGV